MLKNRFHDRSVASHFLLIPVCERLGIQIGQQCLDFPVSQLGALVGIQIRCIP